MIVDNNVRMYKSYPRRPQRQSQPQRKRLAFNTHAMQNTRLLFGVRVSSGLTLGNPNLGALGNYRHSSPQLWCPGLRRRHSQHGMRWRTTKQARKLPHPHATPMLQASTRMDNSAAAAAAAATAAAAAAPVVLVTNDDGINAPGLRFLVDQLAAIG